MSETFEPSRRGVLRGAAVAGTLVWAAPVVQVIAPSAHAAGSIQPALSYVALLLQRGTTVWRVKYEFMTPGGDVQIEVVAGPDWTAGLCEQERSMPFYKGGAGIPKGTTLSEDLPPIEVVSSYDIYAEDGGFYAVLPVGVTMLDWIVHKGQCCVAQTSRQDDFGPCQPGTPSGAYKAQFLQYVDDGAKSGNQWLFPAAPNDELCKTLGGKSHTQACLPTSTTGTPRKT